jgi:hypothetical protein
MTTDNNRPRKISITIVDTMLLAPTGQQSLAALGDMLEVAKVTLPFGTIERMDLLRETNPVLFDRYALRDAEIAALWVQKVLDFLRVSLEIDGVRIPATLGSAGARTFKQQFDKGELDTLLGYEIITNGRFKNRLPIAVIADHFSFFADCYHGGRNEAYTVGYSDVGDIIDIDLAGAYTTAMAGIQTPDWGKTIVTIEILQLAKVDVLSVARVNFKFPDNIRFPSLPVRAGERGLIYPQSGTSYCTGAELVVALEQGAVIDVEHGVVVPYADDQRPFAKFTTTINDMLNRRQYRRRAFSR